MCYVFCVLYTENILGNLNIFVVFSKEVCYNECIVIILHKYYCLKEEGPSLNILIKLMTIVSLVFAPLILQVGGLF
jgi:hypothetical protein